MAELYDETTSETFVSIETIQNKIFNPPILDEEFHNNYYFLPEQSGDEFVRITTQDPYLIFKVITYFHDYGFEISHPKLEAPIYRPLGKKDYNQGQSVFFWLRYPENLSESAYEIKILIAASYSIYSSDVNGRAEMRYRTIIPTETTRRLLRMETMETLKNLKPKIITPNFLSQASSTTEP